MSLKLVKDNKYAYDENERRVYNYGAKLSGFFINIKDELDRLDNITSYLITVLNDKNIEPQTISKLSDKILIVVNDEDIGKFKLAYLDFKDTYKKFI